MDEPESSQNQVSSLVGTIVADRYRVQERLGEGAMGAVYRAEHIHMQKLVALKVLHSETSGNVEVVRRFEREAVAAARVVHSHVASALDFGQLADGSFYLVLEYVAGQSLREMLHEQGALAPERACRIAEQVAAALAVAHQAGVVHRDLKPENVMLLEGTEHDFVKVLDFGLAKLGHEDGTDTKLTKMGAVYGTPQYMAPEQAAGTEVDHRADLYALGVMLYEMLAGHPPFQSEQMVALLVKHMTEEVPRLPPHVPRELSRLVFSLLEKKVEDRLQSAELLGVALQALSLNPGERATRGSLLSLGARPSSLGIGQSSDWKDRAKELAYRGLDEARVPVVIRGKRVPRWVVGAVPFVTGVIVILTFTGGDTPPEGGPAKPSASKTSTGTTGGVDAVPAPADSELRKVLDAARAGSDSALYALEQRSDDERSAAEWLALCQARLMRRDVDQGLRAFGAAIEQDKAAAEDEVILGALRALTKDGKDAKTILNFAAERLGSTGADFLFFVWAKTSAKNDVTTLAGELLGTRAVKNAMSNALGVAMALREAKSCTDYKTLLPELEKHGDQRSMVKIRDLELDKTRGCGSSKRDDCYPCLRGDNALRDAITQASMRAAPQFELGRRFRFLR